MLYCTHPYLRGIVKVTNKKVSDHKDNKKTKDVSEELKRKKALKKLQQEDEEENYFSELLEDVDDDVYQMLKKLK